MDQYLPVLGLLVLAALFAAISFVASWLFAPRRSTEAKAAPYECGIVPSREPPDRFPVRFYLVAMIFIVFDIEIIFLYPFTQIFRELGGFGLGDIVLFSATLFIPFLFLVSNGALDWGPIKRLRKSDIRIGAHRTTTTTVRRVGTEGRGAVVDIPTPRPETEAA